VTFAVKFIAATKRDDWECDEWRATFTKDKVSISFAYFTGTGHRKIPKASAHEAARMRRAYGNTCERQPAYKALFKPVAPDAASVLYCLLLDASANNQSFLDWCSDFGYDSDSIKAQNTYNECCKTAQELRKVFNHDMQQALQEALQDF
jgi:hypothetical protein